jgi:hypothetical protein
MLLKSKKFIGTCQKSTEIKCNTNKVALGSLFNFIKDRIWRKINSWSSKCLSKAGREVLIKSVLQTIPSYVMSIFLIPDSLIDAIEKMMIPFGGVTVDPIIEAFTGCHGRNSRCIKIVEVWGLKTLLHST